MVRSSPAIQERQARARQGLIYLVEQAKAQGEIPAELPTSLVVRNYFCQQNLLNDPGLKEEFASSEKALDDAVEAVVQMFLHGVVTPHVAGGVAETPGQNTAS